MKDDIINALPKDSFKHVKLQTDEEYGQSTVYHISDNHDIKSFIPVVTTRGITGENRSIPRVCASPSIVDTILGHQAVTGMQWGRNDKNGLGKKKTWKIYGFEFEYVALPTARILPDVKATNECWLIQYDDDTKEYKPIHIGEFLLESTLVRGVFPMVELTLNILVKHPKEPCSLVRGVFEPKGYHRLTFTVKNDYKTVVGTPAVEAITADDYKSVLDGIVSMESSRTGNQIYSEW